MITGSSPDIFEKSKFLNFLEKEKKEQLRERFQKASPSSQKTFCAMTGRLDKQYVAKANSDMALLIKKARLLLDSVRREQTPG